MALSNYIVDSDQSAECDATFVIPRMTLQHAVSLVPQSDFVGHFLPTDMGNAVASSPEQEVVNIPLITS
ncbi:hypothetical protein PGT21_029604 [Puccinia graminis f. sp. tritici]|uniref:Uncharacterized protein n=1 Tax=Puccinia graminis f. sp. tritici TaxID=56615 RepID=A0A5B0LS66_PUCGR|nr:hypothetical protein PGT21_029604 [Puccinia graminis f. sp. tritici]KAA1082008.1 hypothetical protein PGTUg99_032516 [Puccinia graminis f. sp. tritici]